MDRCALLRSLHRPGAPLILPNAWDVASAKAVVAAGFPVVATTSGGVAVSLGYEDHERAPAEEMLDAAARICRSVDVPVTVDAEAGYGMPPTDLAAALRGMGAAGCNIEETDHSTGALSDPDQQAARLRALREAASDQRYRLVVNARIDVFLPGVLAGTGDPQRDLVPDALRRAHAYVAAGADCVFPITLREPDALAAFVAQSPAPVNVLRIPDTPSIAELAGLGVARVSYASLLHRGVMQQFGNTLASIAHEAACPRPERAR